jgi:predicted Zn-dependent protease
MLVSSGRSGVEAAADKVVTRGFQGSPHAYLLPMRLIQISRRRLFPLLAGGALLAVSPGCSENAATGRRQFVLMSDAQLADLGAQAWADVKSKYPASSDARARARLETIGGRVADASGLADLDWEFVLFDSPEINAFVLPGGKVGVFKGLVDLAGDDEEIAAVIGHEAGHVVARHAAERMSQQMAVNLAAQAAAIALSEEYGQYADDIAAALGMGLVYGVVLPYSRKHEFEADRLGVGLMSKAAYEPEGAARFWKRMIDTSAARPKPLEFLSTHPADDSRLEALAAEIARLNGETSAG